MTYNEWCEYAQFGQTCEYDNQILQFVEQYNNAKHQQFLNQIDNDRSNRSVQRDANFWDKRRDVSPTYGNGSDSSVEFYTRPYDQEVHTAVLRW
jgi:hypothetical protein